MSGKFNSPTTSGSKGQPPSLPGGKKFWSGVKSPTTQGKKGVPPMSGGGSRKAPRD